jgi:hypothetical protein
LEVGDFGELEEVLGTVLGWDMEEEEEEEEVKNEAIWNEVMGEGGGETQTRNAVRKVGVALMTSMVCREGDFHAPPRRLLW